MIIVALIRTSILPRAATVQDVPYELFLLQMEGCIGVLMAAVSAFRSLFASQGSRASRKKQNILWTAREKIWDRRKRALGSESDVEANNDLPAIPSATMTGLRSFIGGAAKQDVLMSESDEGSDNLPLAVTKPETLHSQSVSTGDEV